MVPFDVFVAVPVTPRKAVVVAGPDLNEPDASFQQTTSDKALAAKVLGFFRNVNVIRIGCSRIIQSVHLQCVLRFFGKIERFRSAELHFCSHFVAANAGFQSRISVALLFVILIQLLQ